MLITVKAIHSFSQLYNIPFNQQTFGLFHFVIMNNTAGKYSLTGILKNINKTPLYWEYPQSSTTVSQVDVLKLTKFCQTAPQRTTWIHTPRKHLRAPISQVHTKAGYARHLLSHWADI